MAPIVLSDPRAARDAFRRETLAAKTVTAVTGAGVSTECGVPDFRSPGSPWGRYPPIGFSAFLASADARAEAWRRKFAIDDLWVGAKPGRAHRALADLHAAGRLLGVVTQNIDGLHLAAGLPAAALVELHGNGTFATCLSCGDRHDLAPIRARLERTGEAPLCACGGFVKSATIAFGQAVPADRIERARRMVESCDLCVVAGSSLVVVPAARLPALARRAGARLVIINREATPCDGLADLVLRAEIGPLFEGLAGTEDTP